MAARLSVRVFLLSLAGYAALFAAFLLLMPLIMGPYGGVQPAGLFESAYALAFALPAAALAWARARLLDGGAQGVPRRVAAAGMSVAGFIVALLLVTARSHLPDDGWNALPSPPAPLASLVRTSPVTVLDGVVYGATADGKVLGLFCAAGNGCAWEAVRDLPPPPAWARERVHGLVNQTR